MSACMRCMYSSDQRAPGFVLVAFGGGRVGGLDSG